MFDEQDDDRAAIIADYLRGVTVPALARRYHRTNRTIARILRAAGVAGTLQRRRDEARRGLPSPAHLRGLGLTGQPSGPEWAYIAGFFDGEGSIVETRARPSGPGGFDVQTAPTASAAPDSAPCAGTLRDRPGAAHVRYRVSIVQKDPTPLIWIRELLGIGDIYFANGTHRYQLQNQRAVSAFLLGVKPHLVVKRGAAATALAMLAASYGLGVGRQQDGDQRQDSAEQDPGEPSSGEGSAEQ